MTLSLEEAFNRFVRSRRRKANKEQRERCRRKIPGIRWPGFQRRRFVIDFSINLKRAILVEGNSVSWVFQDRKEIYTERSKVVTRKPKGYRKHNNVIFDFTELQPRQEFFHESGTFWYFIADNCWEKPPNERIWLQFGMYKHLRDDCLRMMVRQSKKAMQYGIALFQYDNPDVLPCYLWDHIVSLLTG